MPRDGRKFDDLPFEDFFEEYDVQGEDPQQFVPAVSSPFPIVRDYLKFINLPIVRLQKKFDYRELRAVGKAYHETFKEYLLALSSRKKKRSERLFKKLKNLELKGRRLRKKLKIYDK